MESFPTTHESKNMHEDKRIEKKRFIATPVNSKDNKQHVFEAEFEILKDKENPNKEILRMVPGTLKDLGPASEKDLKEFEKRKEENIKRLE